MGHTEIVTKLLAANADVNQADGYGETPLYVASQEGFTEIVTKLLAANADVNHAEEDDDCTPLFIASQKGHTEIVEKLIAANVNVNHPLKDGATPLYVASQNGHTAVVAALLAANADANQAKNNGATPMSIACSQGHLGVVQLLSSDGARRTWPRPAPGDTAEHWAAHYGHHDLVAWLVLSRLWSTPLHHLEFITRKRALALLRAGADIRAAAEPGGPTPLSLALDLALTQHEIWLDLVVQDAAACDTGAAVNTAAFLVIEAMRVQERHPWDVWSRIRTRTSRRRHARAPSS